MALTKTLFEFTCTTLSTNEVCWLLGMRKDVYQFLLLNNEEIYFTKTDLISSLTFLIMKETSLIFLQPTAPLFWILVDYYLSMNLIDPEFQINITVFPWKYNNPMELVKLRLLPEIPLPEIHINMVKSKDVIEENGFIFHNKKQILEDLQSSKICLKSKSLENSFIFKKDLMDYFYLKKMMMQI